MAGWVVGDDAPSEGAAVGGSRRHPSVSLRSGARTAAVGAGGAQQMKTHVAQLFRYGLLVLGVGSRQVGSWPLHAGGDLELGSGVGVADPKGSGPV